VPFRQALVVTRYSELKKFLQIIPEVPKQPKMITTPLFILKDGQR
jgi:hypothetical protein